MLTSNNVELEFVRLFGPACVNPFNGLLSVFYGQHSQPCRPHRPRRRHAGSGSEPRSQFEFTIISSFDVAARFQRTFYALSHICIGWQKREKAMGRDRKTEREGERWISTVFAISKICQLTLLMNWLSQHAAAWAKGKFLSRFPFEIDMPSWVCVCVCVCCFDWHVNSKSRSHFQLAGQLVALFAFVSA